MSDDRPGLRLDLEEAVLQFPQGTDGSGLFAAAVGAAAGVGLLFPKGNLGSTQRLLVSFFQNYKW